MTKRDYMALYRAQNGLAVRDMAIKCKVSQRLIHILENDAEQVTHPQIAKRIGKAYKLNAQQVEGLMPEIHRKSSPNYDPTRYVVGSTEERRQPRVV